ncbi:MAG TPA: acyl-CoA dehydrogenase family protein [Candidatus Obscuribacter sp.]|nr:acyl-CoA dehydrogenase family protein [Candidatus Obscuribacter sp.]MBL8084369.1 acyl-CoA dehydrogenase family protein [Candidatus Obscuribacter sp.]HMW88456.1 acyl-CoA dehydrogenase family protein [Candidatus Obscuribacter sp.]HNB15538.1 acyl-CoA dehydrogenase family protein [Candidatus Obscuribacter sp.]HND05576.1 acyl-CoA dehydrogenase family protein [Candidatus Obscuribacter sp.]
MTETHLVTNQSQPLVGHNLFSQDRVLFDLVNRYGGDWSIAQLTAFGLTMGSQEAIDWACQANENQPVLKTHDRFGHRVDMVEFHPAYHNLMQTSIQYGLHNLPWKENKDGAHVARAAMLYMAFQNEAGHCCPISMTYSVIPALRKQPDIAARWEALILSNEYDGRFLPASQKKGVTFGMGMTEKQGGSDVRANTTRAVPAAEAGPGKEYKLTGHKWFCSAPMSDAFLILAQTDKGVSCFLVPRFKEDGSKNSLRIQRLKEKLGNKSNASSELEFVDAQGFLIGQEGRGVATIIEMVNHTRLDCMLGASALMRQATLQAINHARHRSAFGKKLIDQPLMLNVLADLALESEAAIRLTMRVARAYDQHDKSPSEALFKRIGSAIAKYWVCKRAPMHVAEALECFGGNGYVEEGPMPRLFRESPLLGIWEGSGNVICLDVLRAVAREPETLDAVTAELKLEVGKNRQYDRFVGALEKSIAAFKKALASQSAGSTKSAGAGSKKKPSKKAMESAFATEAGARRLVEHLALALQARMMLEQSTRESADAFIASRLGRSGYAFGTLDPARVDVKAIVDQAWLS